MVSDFMETVASDLDINLEIQVDAGRNRFSYINMAASILSRTNKPDYLIFMCREHVTAPMLRMAAKAGVKVFTFDTNVPKAAQEALGAPRQVLDNWIGHVAPDNVAAGRTLARILEDETQEKKLSGLGQALPIIALSGTLDSSAATDRNIGLQQVVAEELPVPVLQYHLKVATQDNVDLIERVLNPDNWQRVNFARFSRALNPELRNQPPDANRLMDGFTAALEGEGAH